MNFDLELGFLYVFGFKWLTCLKNMFAVNVHQLETPKTSNPLAFKKNMVQLPIVFQVRGLDFFLFESEVSALVFFVGSKRWSCPLTVVQKFPGDAAELAKQLHASNAVSWLREVKDL